MEKLLIEMGFEKFTGILWKHPKFGIMQFTDDESVSDIAHKIYERGWNECTAIIRASLGIDK